jgi:sugar/nucleoside kinase (ribokinase family)
VKKYTVYGVGNALVDTEIQVEDAELEEMGVEKGLMTLVDERRQRQLSDHLEGHLVAAKRASGGSAANTVIATTRFGGSAFYSCKVANDDNGDFYLEDLEAAGVDHNWEHDREPGTTGRCLVLISPDAERSMNSFLGISGTMASSELNAAARAAAVEARTIAEAAGVKTVLSFSDPGMVEFFRDGMQEMVGEKPLHLLFCNEDEAKAWAGSDDLDATATALKQVADNFVITLGARGALIHDGESTFEIAGHSIVAVDSNGAGDMFAGAFLYALGAGHDYRTAGNFASLAAARVVSRFGPRLSAVEHDELIAEFFGLSETSGAC